MKYSSFNFYTPDDIFNIARDAYKDDNNTGKKKLEKVINALNEKQEVIPVLIKEINMESSDESYTPEVAFSMKTRYFIKADDTLYVESKEMLHIKMAKSEGKLLTQYFDEKIKIIEENERQTKEYMKELGEVGDTRIKEELVENKK